MQIKVTKRHFAAKHWMLARWKGWLFVGSWLIKDMPIKQGLPPGQKLRKSLSCQIAPSRTVLGCPRTSSTCMEKLQSLVSWQSLTDPQRAQGRPGREEEVPTSAIYCLSPEATVRRKTTLGGLLRFYTHKTGLYNRVKILHLSSFHHVTTSIKNISEVIALISPSSACLCLEVDYESPKNCIWGDFLLFKNESLKLQLGQK